MKKSFLKKKLKIAQVAPLFLRIPPKKYGGLESVVYDLTNELVKRGHEVTLFATGDSKTKAKLISITPRGLIEQGTSWQNPLLNLLNLYKAFKLASRFDIIHTHIDTYELFFPSFSKTPTLHTIHNPLLSKKGLSFNTRLKIFNFFRNNNFVAISQSQKKLSQPKLKFIDVVYNGIDLERFKFNPSPKNHFIWIGRLHKDKGIENAIRAAKKAGVRLLLAGRKESESEKNYFEKIIKPMIKNSKISYVGEIPLKRKIKFFREAKALIYPIEWEEPFGLVMIEAMACGTPVIAYPKGAVPEIVEDKKTGFLCQNINQVVQAIKKINEIKRLDCRKHVEKNFSAEIMAKNYLKIYYKILERKNGNS